MTRGRKKEWYVGKLMGKIIIKEQLKRSGWTYKYRLQCIVCHETSDVWTTDLSKGNWKVCEHDLD